MQHTRYLLRARRHGAFSYLKMLRNEEGVLLGFHSWVKTQQEATWFLPSEKKYLKQLHETMIEIRDQQRPVYGFTPYMKFFVSAEDASRFDRKILIGILILKIEVSSTVL